MNQSLFCYCGNKGRLLDLYRAPPTNTKRIVELYLGSGAFALNHDLPALGIDQDARVVGLWHWLQQTTPAELLALDRLVSEARLLEPKLDIRTLPISEGARLYLKINLCGLVVGQWSSWSLYPQHKLPLDRTLKALGQAKQTEVLWGDAAQYVVSHQHPGDLVFIDPPYVGTSANYLSEKGYKPSDTLDWLSKITNPVIFAYGDGAPDVFPGLPWEKVKERSVPNFRNGGVVKRMEYVCYLNWPEDDVAFSFFG